ncbi:MAG: hypothetical protein CSA26_09965 [Desulfobacterales bacterium]|nr:MAG: hypothetical protein CSA26_09965 [Desulfobacterales bacterium]
MHRVVYQREGGLKLSESMFFTCSAPGPKETCWLCSEKIGNGYFHQIIIRQGFEIWISDYTFLTDIISEYVDVPPMLQFTIVESGHFQIQKTGASAVYEYSGEHQGVSFFNDARFTRYTTGNIPVKSVSVIVRPEFFHTYLEEGYFTFPQLLACIFAPDKHEGFYFKCPLSQSPRKIAQQIAACQLTGIKRKLFLESKAFELMYYQFENLSNPQLCGETTCKMHPQDKKQTERARDFLLSNLETPPCLQELARSAGMSHPKLNRCFKQMYGMTVFQCLRYERLYKAKTMLEDEGLSVTETAYLVGYDSLSHFSQAYKKQFGISPSSSLRVV